MIVANERAMTAAIALAKRIDGRAILSMHSALLERTDPDIAGRGEPNSCGSAAATSAPTERRSSRPTTVGFRRRSTTWWRSSIRTTGSATSCGGRPSYSTLSIASRPVRTVGVAPAVEPHSLLLAPANTP
jgi:hypothetical protein